jgi:hypothetical protein
MAHGRANRCGNYAEFVSFKQVIAVGWQPLGLMLAKAIWIAALGFFAVRYLI